MYNTDGQIVLNDSFRRSSFLVSPELRSHDLNFSYVRFFCLSRRAALYRLSIGFLKGLSTKKAQEERS